MPSFNHTPEDGFYTPCKECWNQMPLADQLTSLNGRVRDMNLLHEADARIRNGDAPINVLAWYAQRVAQAMQRDGF
jgi:hypothetical protein